MNNEYRHLLRVCEDIVTVPDVINELYKEYMELGYKIRIKTPSSFSYTLDDGSVIMVYWENGKIYENAVLIRGEQTIENNNFPDHEQ